MARLAPPPRTPRAHENADARKGRTRSVQRGAARPRATRMYRPLRRSRAKVRTRRAFRTPWAEASERVSGLRPGAVRTKERRRAVARSPERAPAVRHAYEAPTHAGSPEARARGSALDRRSRARALASARVPEPAWEPVQVSVSVSARAQAPQCCRSRRCGKARSERVPARVRAAARVPGLPARLHPTRAVGKRTPRRHRSANLRHGASGKGGRGRSCGGSSFPAPPAPPRLVAEPRAAYADIVWRRA